MPNYQKCLAHELRRRGFSVECEMVLPIKYEGLHIDSGYRIDMLVEKAVIIENKSVERLLPIHMAQLLTYLKMNECGLGFLLNRNVLLMKNGIKRVVNNLPE